MSENIRRDEIKGGKAYFWRFARDGGKKKEKYLPNGRTL